MGLMRKGGMKPVIIICFILLLFLSIILLFFYKNLDTSHPNNSCNVDSDCALAVLPINCCDPCRNILETRDDSIAVNKNWAGFTNKFYCSYASCFMIGCGSLLPPIFSTVCVNNVCEKKRQISIAEELSFLKITTPLTMPAEINLKQGEFKMISIMIANFADTKISNAYATVSSASNDVECKFNDSEISDKYSLNPGKFKRIDVGINSKFTSSLGNKKCKFTVYGLGDNLAGTLSINITPATTVYYGSTEPVL